MSGSNRPVKGAPRRKESCEDESEGSSDSNQSPVQGVSDEQATGTSISPRQQSFHRSRAASHSVTLISKPSEGVGSYVGTSSRQVQTYRPSEMIPSPDESQVIQGSQEATGHHRRAAVTRPMATNTDTIFIAEPDAGRLMLYEETTTVCSEISVVEALEDENISRLLVDLLNYVPLPVLDKTIQFVTMHAPRHLRKLILIRKERNLELLGDTQGVPQPQPVSLRRPRSHEKAVQVPAVASDLPASPAEVVHESSMSSSPVYVSTVTQQLPQYEQALEAQHLFDQPHTSSSCDDGSWSSSPSAAPIFVGLASHTPSTVHMHTQVSGSSPFSAVPLSVAEPNVGEGMLRQSSHYHDLSSSSAEGHLEHSGSMYSDFGSSSAYGSSASLPSSLSFTSRGVQLKGTESIFIHPYMTSSRESTTEMVPRVARMWETYPTQHELLEGEEDSDVTSLDDFLARQNEAGLAEAQVGFQGQEVSGPLELVPKSAVPRRQTSSTQTRVIAHQSRHHLTESAAHHSRTDLQTRPSLMLRTELIKSSDSKPEVKASLHYLSGVEQLPLREETTGREEPPSAELQRTFSLPDVLETSPAEGGREDPACLYETGERVPPTPSSVHLGHTPQSQLERTPLQSQDASERSTVTRHSQRSIPVIHRTSSDSAIFSARLVRELQAWQSASLPSILRPSFLRSTIQPLQQITEIMTQDIHRQSITDAVDSSTHTFSSLEFLDELSISTVSIDPSSSVTLDPSDSFIQSHLPSAVLPLSRQPVIGEVFENRSIVRDSIRHGGQDTSFVPQSLPEGSSEQTESVSQSRTLPTNEIEVVLQRVNYDVTHQEIDTAQPEEASSVSVSTADNNRAMMESPSTSSGTPFPVELYYRFRSVSEEVHSSSVLVTPSDIDTQSGGTYSIPPEEANFLPDNISTIEIIPRRQSVTINDEELFAVGDSSGMTSIRGARVRHMSIFGEGAAGFDQGVGTHLSRRASRTSSVGEKSDERRLRREILHQTVAELEHLERLSLESPITSESLRKMQDVGGEKSKSGEEAKTAGHDQGVELGSYTQKINIATTRRELFHARRKLLQSMAEFVNLVDTGVPTIEHYQSARGALEDVDRATSDEQEMFISVDTTGSTGVYRHIDFQQPLKEAYGYFLEESRDDTLAGFVGESYNDNNVLMFIQDHNDSIAIYLHDRLKAIIVLNNTEIHLRTISTINNGSVIKFLKENIRIIIHAFKHRISGLKEFVGYIREMMLLHPFSIEELNFHHSGDHNTNLPISVMDSAALLMGSLIESSCICLTSDASTIIYPTLNKNINFTKAGIQTIMEGESVMIDLTDIESESLCGVLSSTIQQICDVFSQSIRLRQAVSCLIHTAACLISTRPICLTVKCTTDGRRLIMITKENPYVPPLNETPSVESREELQAEGRAEEGHPVAQSAVESEVPLLPRSMLEKEEPETHEGSSQITEPGPCTKQPHIEQSSKYVVKSDKQSRPKSPVNKHPHFEGLPLPPQKPCELQQSTSLQPELSTSEPQPSTSEPQPSTSFQPQHGIQDISDLPVEQFRTSQVEEMSSHTSDIFRSRPRSPQKHARRPPLSRQHHDQPEECLYGAQGVSYDTESDIEDTYEIIFSANTFDENSIAGYIIPDYDQLGGIFLQSFHQTLIFFHHNDGFTTLFLSSKSTGVIINEDTAKHKRMMSKLANRGIHKLLKEKILSITGSSGGLVSSIRTFIKNICEIQQQMPHTVEPSTSRCSVNQASSLLRFSSQEEFIREAQASLQLLISIGNHTLYSQEPQGAETAITAGVARNKLENLVSALLYVHDSLGSAQQAEVSRSEAASTTTASKSKSLISQPVTETSISSYDQPIHFLYQKPSLVHLGISTVTPAEHEHRPELVGSSELIQISRPLHTVDNTTGYFVSHDESLAGLYACSDYDAQICFQDAEGITSLFVSTNKDAVIIHETTNKQCRLITPIRDPNLRVGMLCNITKLACIPSGPVEGVGGLTSSINELVSLLPHVVEGQELDPYQTAEEKSELRVKRSLSMDYVIRTAFSAIENMVENVNVAFDQNRQVHTLYGPESLETIREQRALVLAPELTESPYRRRMEQFIFHLEDLMGRVVVQQPLRAPLPRPTSELRSEQESLRRPRLESFPRSSRKTSLERFDEQDQADQVSGKLVKTLPETTEHKYEVPSNKPSVQTGSEVFVSIRSNVEQEKFEVEIADESSVSEQVSDVLGTGEAVQIYEETTAEISPVSLRQTGSVEVSQIIIPDLPEAVTGYFMSLDQNLIGVFCQQSNGYSEFVFKDQAGSTSVYLHSEKPSVILHETEETQERIASLIDDQDLKINLMNYISDVTASIGSTVSGLSRLTQNIRDEVNILPRIDDEQVTEICDLFQQPIQSPYLEEAVSTVPLSIQNLIKAKSRMLCSPQPVLASLTPKYHTTLQQTQDDFEVCEDLFPHGEHMVSAEIISINVSLEPEDYAGYFVLEDGQTVGIFYLLKESRILFINDEIGGTVLYLPNCQSGIIVHEIAESHQREMCNLSDEKVCVSLINDLRKLLKTFGSYVSDIKSLILNIRNLLSFTIQERQAKEQISKHQSERSPGEQELVNHAAAAALESLLKIINLALSSRGTQMVDVAASATSEVGIRSEHVNCVQTAASIMLNLHAELSSSQDTDKEKEKQVPQDTSSREKEADQPVQNEPQESQQEQIIPKAKPQRQRYKKLRFSEKATVKDSEATIQSSELVSRLSSASQDLSTKPSVFSTSLDSENDYSGSSVYQDAKETQSFPSVCQDVSSDPVSTTPPEQPGTTQQEVVTKKSPVKETSVTPAVPQQQAVEELSRKSTQLKKPISKKEKPAGSQMKGAIRKEKTFIEPQQETSKKSTREKATQHLSHKVLQKERTLEKSTKDKPQEIPIAPAELQQQGAVKKSTKEHRKLSLVTEAVPHEKQGAIKKKEKTAPTVPKQQGVSIVWEKSKPVEFIHPTNVSATSSAHSQTTTGMNLESELKIIYEECFKLSVDVRLHVNDVVFIRQSQLLLCCEEGLFYYDMDRRIQTRLFERFTKVQKLFFTHNSRYSSYLVANIGSEMFLVKVLNVDLLEQISNLTETATSQAHHLACERLLSLPYKTVQKISGSAVMNESNTFLGYYSGRSVMLTELEGNEGGILTDRDIQSEFTALIQYLTFLDDKTVIVYAGKFYILQLEKDKAFFPLLPVSAGLQEITDIINQGEKSFIGVFPILMDTETDYLICAGEYAFRVAMRTDGYITQRYWIPGMRSAELLNSNILRVLQGNCIAYYDLSRVRSRDTGQFFMLTLDSRSLEQSVSFPTPRFVRAQHGVQPETECVVGSDGDFAVIGTLNNGLVLQKLNLLLTQSKFQSSKDVSKLNQLIEFYKTVRGEGSSAFLSCSESRTRQSIESEEENVCISSSEVSEETERMARFQERAPYAVSQADIFTAIGISGLVKVRRHIRNFLELQEVESNIHRNVTILEKAQRNVRLSGKPGLMYKIESIYRDNLNYLQQVKDVREKLVTDPRSAAHIFPLFLTL